MTIALEAIDENGVLKPTQPLPLREREKVRIAVLTGATVAEQSF
jgi:predicted DNA-binding antitoxin AbrB/MazE fold protein